MPRKRPKKAGPTKRPRLRRALDSQGAQLKAGQRVRGQGAGVDRVLRVEQVFETAHPDGGRCEIVYTRDAEGNLSQVHLPNLTILGDGPRRSPPPLSLRDRLRRSRR